MTEQKNSFQQLQSISNLTTLQEYSFTITIFIMQKFPLQDLQQNLHPNVFLNYKTEY